MPTDLYAQSAPPQLRPGRKPGAPVTRGHRRIHDRFDRVRRHELQVSASRDLYMPALSASEEDQRLMLLAGPEPRRPCGHRRTLRDGRTSGGPSSGRIAPFSASTASIRLLTSASTAPIRSKSSSVIPSNIAVSCFGVTSCDPGRFVFLFRFVTTLHAP